MWTLLLLLLFFRLLLLLKDAFPKFNFIIYVFIEGKWNMFFCWKEVEYVGVGVGVDVVH